MDQHTLVVWSYDKTPQTTLYYRGLVLKHVIKDTVFCDRLVQSVYQPLQNQISFTLSFLHSFIVISHSLFQYFIILLFYFFIIFSYLHSFKHILILFHSFIVSLLHCLTLLIFLPVILSSFHKLIILFFHAFIVFHHSKP